MRWPTAPAYEDADGSIDFASLRESSRRLAGVLRHLGVPRGGRVATVLPASRLFVELFHAAQQARVTLVPLHPRLQGPELARLLTHAAPTLVVTETRRKGELGQLPGGGGVACEVIATETLAQLEASVPAAACEFVESPEASDVLTMVNTSGTTAEPKGVLLSNANFEAGALASCERLGCQPGDRWLTVMPMCHVAGLAILVRACLLGMTVVQQPRFDAKAVGSALREEGICFVSLVPTMLSMLLEDSDVAPFPSTLRAVVLGGGRLPPAVVRRGAERGLPLVATFGMTETAAQVTTSYPGDASLQPGCAGHPLPGIELRIDTPDATGLGEILVRGEQVFGAYHQAPDLTARTLSGGWLHTGDLGRLDAEGRLWVEVRRSDLVVSGGENVHPEEVEEVLKQHPAVADAGVFGITDEHWGQRVAASVVLTGVTGVDVATLQAWCRARLAAYKVPREIHFASSLPRTESGKLQRQRLQSSGSR